MLNEYRYIHMCSLSAARKIRDVRFVGLRWRGIVILLVCTTVITAAVVAAGFHYIYFDRTNLPDIGPFARFEFPAIGRVYDANDQPFMEMAREYRWNIKYEDIPPIVRDAIIATEDKNFFSHSGVDYSIIPRVLGKVRIGTLVERLTSPRQKDEVNRPAIFPHGGSTITQQLVRGHFLKDMTAQENSNQLRHGGFLHRALSYVTGPRSVNMLVRKLEEIRLSLWVEREMQARFASKRRAKEEILARYASFIYMGNSQYGFAVAAEYYFNRSLNTFTVDDADKAALLAGIAKSPRTYAPSAKETGRVLRRRDQTLALMAKNGFISWDTLREAEQRPVQVVSQRKDKLPQAPAVIENLFEELKGHPAGLNPEDLRHGRIHVYATVDARMQQIVNEALEHGIELYEKRHPSAKGLVQGSVVVLRNRDAGILAQPYVIRRIVRDSGEGVADNETVESPLYLDDGALSLIQEGLRGVVRIPGGTAHALNSDRFPIAVMGKTGTTNEFRDALFIGSTYGTEGITVAVRIGFDDNRSLGRKETGGRVALPVFREIMLRAYREKQLGPVPEFPAQMEQRINAYLGGDSVVQ